MSYYPEPDIHIRDKVKVVLHLSNYATKNILLLWKLKAYKLNIHKLVNAPTSLNNLKTKVEDLDLCKLETALVALQKLNDAVDFEVVKSTELNILTMNVNNLDKKIPGAIKIIHINNKTQINKI